MCPGLTCWQGASSGRGAVRTGMANQAWVAQEGSLQFRQMNVDFPRRACGSCQVSGDQGLLEFGAQVAHAQGTCHGRRRLEAECGIHRLPPVPDADGPNNAVNALAEEGPVVVREGVSRSRRTYFCQTPEVLPVQGRLRCFSHQPVILHGRAAFRWAPSAAVLGPDDGGDVLGLFVGASPASLPAPNTLLHLTQGPLGCRSILAQEKARGFGGGRRGL